MPPLNGNQLVFLNGLLNMTLTFDILTLKSIWVNYRSQPKPHYHVKRLKTSHCDLDLWPNELWINRCHPSVITNLTTKSDDCIPKCSLVINWTSFCGLCHSNNDLNPTDLKIKKSHLLVKTNLLDNLRTVGQSVL